MPDADELLMRTSRTFGLAIPLLPEPTRTEVKIAYLLFRIIDTFEDATRWAPARSISALHEFAEILTRPPRGEAHQLAAACLREPPVERGDYIDLLANIPLVLEELGRLRPQAQEHIRAHVKRTAQGMTAFVARGNGSGVLELETLHDLREYCYKVAGIVGEMLTELYLLERPELAHLGPGLRSRAEAFGEGLQLVNILKDAGPDAREGRIYLPRSASLADVFTLARDDLQVATTYTQLLREAAAPRGLVAFNALISRLAIATLDVLESRGLGTKLSRLEVMTIMAEVAHGLDTGTSIAATS